MIILFGSICIEFPLIKSHKQHPKYLISMVLGVSFYIIKEDSVHQVRTTATKHIFVGLPIQIQIFHAKNTPVHWGKIHPIKQEYSLVQRKKFIGMKTRFYTDQSHLHCIDVRNKKAEKLLRPNQKLATSLDFNCKDNLSAIRAMNSEFVGFPLVLLTV